MSRAKPVFDDETSQMGCGPLSFDLDISREHGWTDKQIQIVWDELVAVSVTYVRCNGCLAEDQTTEHLEGAL